MDSSVEAQARSHNLWFYVSRTVLVGLVGLAVALLALKMCGWDSILFRYLDLQYRLTKIKWQQSSDAALPRYTAVDGDFLRECAKSPKIRAKWIRIANRTNPLPPKKWRHFQAVLVDSLIPPLDKDTLPLVLKYLSLPEYRQYVLIADSWWRQEPDALSIEDLKRLYDAYKAIVNDAKEDPFVRTMAKHSLANLAVALRSAQSAPLK